MLHKIEDMESLFISYRYLIVLLFSLSLSPACNKDVQNAAQLNGSWKVYALNGKDVAHLEATCDFDIGNLQISGSSGCNRYAADITINEKDQSLHIGNITQTKIGCPGEKGIFEVDFFAALGKVSHYHFSNPESVKLRGEFGGTIELSK